MKNFKYELDPGSKKYICPQCRKKTFVRYIETATRQPLPRDFGRCDREDKCGYHLSPAVSNQGREYLKVEPLRSQADPGSCISSDLFKRSLNSQADNYFIDYLETLFPAAVVQRLVTRYHIGTSTHWPGATVFWQIDQGDRVRGGKVMLYDSGTGRRVKQPFNHVTWVHSILKLKDFKLKQCLFGEHLLKQYPAYPVAIVESEKSAIIASAYLPGYLWLSAGQKNGLSIKKCQVLSGRKVILYPDLGAFEEWTTKAREIKLQIPAISIVVNNLLERKATEAEREQGFDIADYLTCCPYEDTDHEQDPQEQSFESRCYEDRKRNPWPGSRILRRKLTHYPGFEAVWEIVDKPGGGSKRRFLECSRKGQSDHD